MDAAKTRLRGTLLMVSFVLVKEIQEPVGFILCDVSVEEDAC
jgi:hypothetical protein